MPVLRHVQREVRQNAENTNAEVCNSQVGQAEVDDTPHRAQQQDDGDDEHVTWQRRYSSALALYSVIIINSASAGF